MYEISKPYVENYSSYLVRTKVLTKFSCDLDIWPFDPKMYRYLPLRTKVLTKFRCDLDLWTPKCIGIFLSEPKCWQCSVVTLTFGPQNVQVSSSRHPASMYEIWKLHFENYSSYHVRTKVLTKLSLWPWHLDPKMYRYLPLTILHLCMKYESCMLKTTQVIVSEPVLTNFRYDLHLWTPKCIGIFLSPSYIYVWHMEAVSWKLLKLSC